MKLQTKISSVALGLFVFAGAAQAQPTEIQAGTVAAASSSFAGASFVSPIAFGANWGDAGVSVFGERLRKGGGGHHVDGSAGVAFGLGNAERYVGLETDIGISSLSHASGDNFGDAGSLGFKLHTSLPESSAFAVGVVGTGRWGAAAAANRASVYAVGTHVFDWGSTLAHRHVLVANFGVGDEQFVDSFSASPRGIGAFGSVAYYLWPRMSLIMDYTGRFLDGAVSVVPFQKIPLTLALGYVNLTDRAKLGREFAASVGFGISFN